MAQASLVKVPGVPGLYRDPASGSYIRKWKVSGKQRQEKLAALTEKDARLECQSANIQPSKRKPVNRNMRVTPAWREFIEFKTGRDPRAPETGRVGDETEARYATLFRVHIQPVFGHWRVGDIQGEHVGQFLATLRTKKRLDGKGHGYSPGTIAQVHATLSSFLGTMMAAPFGYTDHNAAKDLGNMSPADRDIIPVGPEAVITEEEADAIATVAASETWRAILRLAPEVGLRISEMLGLTRQALDFENGVIKVETQLRGKGLKVGEVETWLKPLKGSNAKVGNRRRTIAMSDHARETLTDYLSWLDRQERATPIQGLLFFSRKYTPLSQTALTREFHRAAKKAGITRPIKFHGYRHAYASGLFAQGANFDDVREMLGHSDVRITEKIYVHVEATGRTAFFDRIRSYGRKATGLRAV